LLFVTGDKCFKFGTQGCQILVGATYQNGRNIPNHYKVYQKAVKINPKEIKIYQKAVKIYQKAIRIYLKDIKYTHRS
jgi:tetratricopeptide (TPR) repeat protein